MQDEKARIRRANETGVRLDGGGDNRPPIYTEGDTVVYRSSAVGKLCPRALWLARTGVEPSPIPERLQKAFVESSNNEQLALAMFTDKHEVALSREQEEFEVPVPGTNAVIRGHIDAYGLSVGMRGVVEVKCISADSWDRRGVYMYPGWMEQIQTQMRGMDVKLCWMVFGKKIDGVVEDVSYTVVEYQPRIIGQVFDAVRQVENAVAEGRALDCPEEKWGCPYWQLHEGTEMTDVVEDRVLAGLATQIVSLSDQIKRADREMRELRDRVMKKLEDLKLPSSIKLKSPDGKVFGVTVVTSSRTLWDDEALDRDGVNLDDYKIRQEGASYVKITKPKES